MAGLPESLEEGTQVRSSARVFGPIAFVCLAVAVGLAAWTVATAIPIPLAFAPYPLAYVLAALLAARGRKRARLRVDGLELPEGRKIPFEDFECVGIDGVISTNRKPVPGASIVLWHRKGVLRFTCPLNVSDAGFHSFLQSKCQENQERGEPVHAELKEYFDEQVAAFGRDRIRVFAGLSHFGPVRHTRVFLRWFCFFVVLAGFASLLIGQGSEAVSVWAMILIVSFTMLLLLLYARSASRTRAKQVVGRCGLVVAPQGIALILGTLKGKLRWDEIRNIEVRQTTNSSAAENYTVIHHLQIRLDGTSIIVVDAFRHSLAVIRGTLHSYWKG